MNGIIVIDKPQGMTSHDVVSFLRRETGVKHIGHSGTLDPMATGVLPVFIGKATRIIEYSGKPDDREAKLYRCRMRLGIETDTQDIWGKTLSESNNLRYIDPLDIEYSLKSFEGPGKQKPPMYSAVKIGGRKLYEYARKGIDLDENLIKERSIYIKQIDVKHIDMDVGEVCFEALCSKGVYIRTLCADAGRQLGCGAVMSGLIRLRSDGFSIESAFSYENLKNRELPQLLPMDYPLTWMTRIDLDEDIAMDFVHGKNIEYKNFKIQPGSIRVYAGDTFIGIGKNIGGTSIKPEKVFV